MTHTKTDALVVLGDTATEQHAEMFAIRAAEHGVIISGIFAFEVGEAAAADDLAEVEEVVAALSKAIATRRDIWMPYAREDLVREEHARRLCMVLQRHGLTLRVGPNLFACPTEGGPNAIDSALRAEVRAVDALDHAVIAAAGIQTLGVEINAALGIAGSPSSAVSAEPDMTYFGTADVAKLFRKSRNWVRWALRNNVFVRRDGTPIEPVRLGTSSRRRFTVPLLHDMAKAAYRRGILDEVELEGVLRELAGVER
ncbi:hypothetical protein [Mycolicibacterium sp.]|jgi:hypothetical protein|uniref:DUF7229 domain-containing protein n=1 Tax=Mycolicibacterium sp. TaxID=2320850 RepID=UPI001A220985|nr:hypothetical protein [Mycolicibacterium sp.]MBJ7401222.1 hypothetical protein [Mycolicibacterium sp.]